MTQHSNPSQQAAGDDQDIMHWFATLPPRRTVEPSPQFPRKVMAQIAAQQARRTWWGWCARLLRVESPAWVPALATGFVLSLGLNVWLGSQVRAPHGPSGEHLWLERTVEEGIRQVTQGDAYVAQRDYANALRAYETFLHADEEAPVAQVLRKVAGVQYQRGQYLQAIEAATAALVLNLQEAQAYRYRGMAREALGDREQAAQDLQQAARLGDPEAQRLLQAWGLPW